MGQRVQSAWLRRWGNLLGCNVAKAFALSLLDRGPPLGAGVDVPSVHEVVRKSFCLSKGLSLFFFFFAHLDHHLIS